MYSSKYNKPQPAFKTLAMPEYRWYLSKKISLKGFFLVWGISENAEAKEKKKKKQWEERKLLFLFGNADTPWKYTNLILFMQILYR